MLSLYAKGLTTGEIAAHFDELYDAKISPDTISRITDKVLADMAEWTARPLRLRRNLHRRAERESARRSGRQPTVLRRDRGRSGRAQGRARTVGRRRRRGISQVLVRRIDRPAQQRRHRHVLLDLRRT
ncbi:transposase, Mutator family protein [Mycobacterium intracellulare MIN_052511_1280]|nr:transposase, Mutator family protein [Mycobacterium intracellulare MIN_052511_1280]